MTAEPRKRPASYPDAGALFRAYGDRVLSYARHYLGSGQDAEDAAARVFMKIHEHWDSYDPGRGAMGTWLYAITQNEVRGVLRRRTRRREADYFEDWDRLADPGPAPEETLLSEERVEELAAALERLPERERDILLLRFYSGLPSKEVAARMGLSDANVRYLQSKALQKLRGLMGEDMV